METLTEVLARYAAENVTARFQQDTAPQTRAAWRQVDQLTSQLKALGPEAAQWMEELKDELLTIDSNREQATLLAGISIGLELGRL